MLNDKLRGFYRRTYIDEDGAEQVIATTQMQATDCRRAFPCWDEPEFKAVFAVTLVVDDGLLGDLQRARDRRASDRRRPSHGVRFADTMVMSTYLVAFVVGPLEATETVDVDGIPLRVVHVPGKGHLTGVRARGRRLRAALVPGLLRHPVPERQGRPRRAARLRRRRDGEPRLHHVPREPAARRPGDGHPDRAADSSPTSSPTSSRTCGSATS